MTHERSSQVLAVPASSVVPLWKVTGSGSEGLQEALTKHPGDLLALNKHCNFLPSFPATCLSVVSRTADVRRGTESWGQKRETKANPACLGPPGLFCVFWSTVSSLLQSGIISSTACEIVSSSNEGDFIKSSHIISHIFSLCELTFKGVAPKNIFFRCHESQDQLICNVINCLITRQFFNY